MIKENKTKRDNWHSKGIALPTETVDQLQGYADKEYISFKALCEKVLIMYGKTLVESK